MKAATNIIKLDDHKIKLKKAIQRHADKNGTIKKYIKVDGVRAFS